MLLEALYIFFIIGSDWLASRYMFHLPFGLMAPAGVLMIAPIFTLRDEIHKRKGARAVLYLIAIASTTSYLVSLITGSAALGKVTVASVAAFIISETTDTGIYQALRKWPFMGRVVWSNFVSAFLDTFVFISMAFGVIWPLIFGQYVLKWLIAYVTGLYIAWRNREGFRVLPYSSPQPDLE